jgi:hypothetical protein
VHTIEDALAHILQSQPGQTGQSTSSEASQHVQIEMLPPILVLHLKRFLHDAAADGIVNNTFARLAHLHTKERPLVLSVSGAFVKPVQNLCSESPLVERECSKVTRHSDLQAITTSHEHAYQGTGPRIGYRYMIE